MVGLLGTSPETRWDIQYRGEADVGERLGNTSEAVERISRLRRDDVDRAALPTRDRYGTASLGTASSDCMRPDWFAVSA